MRRARRPALPAAACLAALLAPATARAGGPHRGSPGRSGIELSAGRSLGGPCPGRATVRGIDVSKWQGEVDWAAVRMAGIRFAFIRVSDGATLPDPAFARNWQAARDAGIIRGAYQYFRPEEDPEEQADLLLAITGPPRAGDLPPALDVEVSGDVEARELVRRVARWTARVRRATGLRPVVYTTALHWTSLARGSRRFRSHPLWVAHHDTDCPATPVGWRRWTFHQFSASSSIPGVKGPVDEDRFRGPLRALRRLTAGRSAAAAARYRRWQRRAAADRARRQRELSSAAPE